jgi:hypothetical protein
VRIVPFEAKHGYALLEGQLNDERNRPAPCLGNFVEALVNEELAFSAIDNGHLIVSAGIYQLWPGVGETWILASQKLTTTKVSLLRRIKKDLFKIADEKGFWRLQASTQSDWPSAKRLAMFLEMKHEGTMKKYGANKENYERWAWVK